jgi:hypothetical protein
MKKNKPKPNIIQKVLIVLVSFTFILSIYNFFESLNFDNYYRDFQTRQIISDNLNQSINMASRPILDALNEKVYFPELRISVDLNKYTRNILYWPEQNIESTTDYKTDSLRIVTRSTASIMNYDTLERCNFNILLEPQSIDFEHSPGYITISSVSIGGVKYNIDSNYDACAKYITVDEYQQIISSLEQAKQY